MLAVDSFEKSIVTMAKNMRGFFNFSLLIALKYYIASDSKAFSVTITGKSGSSKEMFTNAHDGSTS